MHLENGMALPAWLALLWGQLSGQKGPPSSSIFPVLPCAVPQVLRGFARIAPMPAAKLPSLVSGHPKRAAQLSQRLNMALWKLDEAARLMGEGQHKKALHYARSMEHDVKAIEHIALKASVLGRAVVGWDVQPV